jgi:hypothetical protein
MLIAGGTRRNAPPAGSSKRREIFRQWLTQPLFRQIRKLTGQHVVEHEGIEPAQDFRIALLHTDMGRGIAQDEFGVQFDTVVLLHQISGNHVGGGQQVGLPRQEGSCRCCVIVEAGDLGIGGGCGQF